MKTTNPHFDLTTFDNDTINEEKVIIYEMDRFGIITDKIPFGSMFARICDKSEQISLGKTTFFFIELYEYWTAL